MMVFGMSALALAAATQVVKDESLVRWENMWIAKVNPGARSYFYTCPELKPTCRTRAYVVPGDLVVVESTRGRSATAQFISANGAVTQGYLLVPTISRLRVQSPTAPIWAGSWERVEADIRIIPTPTRSTFSIKGYATWGAHDPDRIRRGAINMGNLNGAAKIHNNNLVLKPTGDDECFATMRFLGPYLLVWDNNKCGGHNVTFSGIYRRSTPKKKM